MTAGGGVRTYRRKSALGRTAVAIEIDKQLRKATFVWGEERLVQDTIPLGQFRGLQRILRDVIRPSNIHRFVRTLPFYREIAEKDRSVAFFFDGVIVGKQKSNAMCSFRPKRALTRGQRDRIRTTGVGPIFFLTFRYGSRQFHARALSQRAFVAFRRECLDD